MDVPEWKSPQYAMPKLTGLPRHPTAKNISEFASSRFDHSSLRIPRGSKCAPPPSAEELGSDADDEEEPPDESGEEKDDEEEMSEDEQLYSDFFCEACRDDDGLERDVLHGDGGGADGVADGSAAFSRRRSRTNAAKVSSVRTADTKS